MDLIIILYYCLSLTYIFLRRKDFFSPSVLFCVCQNLMFTGILFLVDLKNESDCKLLTLYLIALSFFILGTFILKRKTIISELVNNEYYDFSRYQRFVMVFLCVFSIVLCTWLFVEAGGNAFLVSVSSIISGTTADIRGLRYGFTRIVGIGYIGQFRGIILPVLNMILLINRKNRFLYKFGLLITPLTIIFLLGTGQRGQFFLCFLVLLENIYYQMKYLKFNFKFLRAFSIVCVVFFMFSILSYSNSRVVEGSSIIGGAIQAFVQRIFNDNQSCAVIGFRYIDTLPTVWGLDWFRNFDALLPGKSNYLPLDSIIFSFIYGSTNGTAPPCIWGSSYYNFGYLGVSLFPLILGLIYEKFYINFLSKKKTQINIGIYSGMFVLMGYWIAGSPMYFFNVGFVTLIILKFLLQNVIFDKNKCLIVFGK